MILINYYIFCISLFEKISGKKEIKQKSVSTDVRFLKKAIQFNSIQTS